MKTKNQTISKRDKIIDTGHRLVSSKGFSSLGLNELLKEAGIPKGSFYHYFKSKESFGQALLDHYFSEYLNALEELFTQKKVTGQEQILNYFELWSRTQTDPDNDYRCLVVKLSAEVADLSEPMRKKLMEGTDRIIDRLQKCLEEGTADGSLTLHDPGTTAHQLYQLWLGASLLSKLHKTGEPFHQAMDATRAILGSSSTTL